MKPFRLNAEIVTGKCPTCNELTMLVGLTKEYYRCMTCGADLEQHVNGKISYIPALTKETLQSVVQEMCSISQLNCITKVIRQLSWLLVQIGWMNLQTY